MSTRGEFNTEEQEQRNRGTQFNSFMSVPGETCGSGVCRMPAHESSSGMALSDTDTKILLLVKKHGKRWDEIQAHMEGWTARQLQQRYTVLRQAAFDRHSLSHRFSPYHLSRTTRSSACPTTELVPIIQPLSLLSPQSVEYKSRDSAKESKRNEVLRGLSPPWQQRGRQLPSLHVLSELKPQQ